MQKPLFLIACSAHKLDHPAPARELYTGQAFRLAMAAADRCGADVLILSALHGVVQPGEVLAPYDHTLRSASERRTWATRTAQHLHSYRQRRTGVLAGKFYAAAAAGFANKSLPLAGLGIGQQLAVLKNFTL
jgi:hypothetical protein